MLGHVASVLLCALLLAAPAGASESGTRVEAVAMVKRVQARFATTGAESTFRAISETDEFRDRDLYPFVYDMDGWSVAHGANPNMVGKLWISTKDQDGNFLIREMIAISREPGHGWVDYKWPNPITDRKSVV